MLLQTNSYIVPKEKRAEHARLVRRFRQTLHRLGCEHFEVYEQVGANWGSGETTGRFVHIMRFRDRKHQLSVQAAERNDAAAQTLINEFCELINFPYQQQQGLFAVGFYQSVLPVATARAGAGAAADDDAASAEDVVEEMAAGEAAADSAGAENAASDAATADDATGAAGADEVTDVIEAGDADADDHVDLGGADAAPDEPRARRNA